MDFLVRVDISRMAFFSHGYPRNYPVTSQRRYCVASFHADDENVGYVDLNLTYWANSGMY